MTPNVDPNSTPTALTTDFAYDIVDRSAERTLTMSSREIAALTGREHDNVRRDIRNMAEGLSLTFEEKSEPSSGGRPMKVFLLPKRESLILVSGYNLAMRAAIIDRWQQLEDTQRSGVILLPKDYASALRALADETEKRFALEGEVEEMRPQVQALERIAISDGSLCVTDAAKTLQVQPKALFSFLRSHGWMYVPHGGRGDIAYQAKLQQGLLEHKSTTVHRSDGSEKTVTQVRVTSKGLTRLAKELPPVARAA